MITEITLAIVLALVVGIFVGAAGMHLRNTFKTETKTREGTDNESLVLIALMLVLRCKYREAKVALEELLVPGTEISTVNRSRIRLAVSRLDLIKSNHL